MSGETEAIRKPIGADAGAQGTVSSRSWLLALACLAALVLAMFCNVLFVANPPMLSHGDADLAHQFVHWRGFGFGELRRGNLALWNPHLFSGAPFFGGFQSALLYPPNALFLILPLTQAVNWSIALHVFLAGAFTFLWTARRGLDHRACFLAGVMFMFCGPHFLHIYAGHLPNLCTLAWAPLIFLAIDGLAEHGSLAWSLLGMFAFAMQVLAGHPQYVFYTGVAATGYCSLGCFKAQNRKRFLLGLAAILFGGVALSAVQLFTGWQESRETLRSIGLSYEAAAQFSFPPENLLTLATPNVFGGLTNPPYWGGGFIWEMSFFISVTGLVLAAAGAIWGERRHGVLGLAMVAGLILLALGGYTPLFKLLYHWIPGFDKFRGSSKFILLASLFLAFLAAVGLDQLIKRGRAPRGLVAGVFAAAILFGAAALVVHPQTSSEGSGGLWSRFFMAIPETRETYLPREAYADPAFVFGAEKQASRSLLMTAGTLLALALALIVTAKFRHFIAVILALAVVELFLFARSHRDTFDVAGLDLPAIKQRLAEHPGDYRILNLASPNAAMSLEAFEIWGYDPCVLRRYAELLAFTQGVNPDQVQQALDFTHDHPLYGMLRCRFMFVPNRERTEVFEHTNVLPRLMLVQRFKVIHERNEIFAALTNAAFDAREQVILETPPVPEPRPGNDPRSFRVVDSGTDELTIEARLSSPAILLMTDAYSKSWHARGLPGSSQKEYQLLPANYCLRAVPLSAGSHLLRVEYRPSGFVVGKWISLFSTAVFVGVAAIWGIRRWRAFTKLADRPDRAASAVRAGPGDSPA